MRLARYFGNSARFWLNLQSYYDLAVAEDELDGDVERDVQPRSVATAETSVTCDRESRAGIANRGNR